MKFINKTVIITGSSRGIGRAAAILFAQEGANVVVNYLTHKSDAEETVKIIGNNNALLIHADVSKETDVKFLISETIKKWRKIDILVNNAGVIFRSGLQSKKIIWDQAMQLNLTNTWLMTKETVPIMLKNGKGAIVNISSIYGFLGAASDLAYSSAKAGVINLTKALAKELAPTIRVNCIAPGNVITDMTKTANIEFIKKFEQQTPLKRSAKPEEIAKAILFLASDEAGFITGQTLVIDGGYSLK